MNLVCVGKAVAVASNDIKQVSSSHTFEPLDEMYDAPPGEHNYFSNTTTCHDQLKNIEPLHTTYSYCKRFRSRVDNFVGVNDCEKFCATNNRREEEQEQIFKDFSNSAYTGNNAKANKSLPTQKGLAASSLISCKVVSCNGFKKSLHRQSDVKKVIPHVVPSLQTTHFLAAAGNVRSIVAGKSSDIASTALPINKSLQQKGSHHKVKCRTGKLRRNQASVMQSTACDMATVTANVKASMKLPNTPLTPATESTKPLHTASTANTLAPTTTTTAAAAALSTLTHLTQTLLDMPVIPQAWQQFVQLLQNSVSGFTTTTTTTSVSTTTSVRKTTKNISTISRLDETRTISGAALIATGSAATAAVRCKANATVMSSMHSTGSSSLRTKFRLLPSLGATSFFTLLTLICLETVLLSTVSNCAKTFYMHWNTSNSIFRIDNTDHIIDVNKGNLAFEFDQVHIICPVYEPGTFENETEKYIIYNVSKVEYETCRITNATPRVIAICDKPQKLMFFTITFRPFTPQPGGLEFLPGNDYYFISTSSKDDLYRRIGGRCSTNNMKVVFKVCCAPEEKNKTAVSSTSSATAGGSASAGGNVIGINSADGSGLATGIDNAANVDVVSTQSNINQHQQHMNNINTIGINGVNTGLIPIGGVNIGGGGGNSGGIGVNNGGMQMKPLNGGSGTSINTNIEQFNRIPIQAGGINVMGNNVGGLGGVSLGGHVGGGGGGIMLTPGGQGGINMISGGVGIGIGQYPGHTGQTGIRINNVASQQHHATHKHNNNNGKDTGTSGVGVGVGVSVDGGGDGGVGVGGNGGTLMNINFGDAQFLPPFINTNHSNIVQSTINWPAWGSSGTIHSVKNNNLTATTRNVHNINEQNNNNYYTPSHSTINNKTIYKNEHYDKHPNEVVKNEELTYHSGATSLKPWTTWTPINAVTSWFVCNIYGWLKQQNMIPAATTVTVTTAAKTTTTATTVATTTATTTTATTVATTATTVATTVATTAPTTAIQFLTRLRAAAHSTPATQTQSKLFNANSVLQLLRQCFVKFKYLIFVYHVSIISCLIVIAAVIIYLLQFVKQQQQHKKATQLELSTTSYLKSVLVHTFHAKVMPKFQFIYLIAPLKTVSKATVGLISLLADQVTARNASHAVRTKQHFTNQQFATTNTRILQNSSLPTAQNCRSQISSVSVKVKRFR